MSAHTSSERSVPKNGYRYRRRRSLGRAMAHRLLRDGFRCVLAESTTPTSPRRLPWQARRQHPAVPWWCAEFESRRIAPTD